MIKNTNKKKHTVRKVLLIVAGVIFIPIILFFIFIFVSNLFDQHKFNVLDNQMQVVLGELKSVAGTDQWSYKKECGAIYSGWMETSSFSCGITLSTEKLTSNPKDVSDWHEKYYPILDSSKILKPKTNFTITPARFFGKELIVSGVEKYYVEGRTGISCVYTTDLKQSFYKTEQSSMAQSDFGAKINNNVGKIITTIECRNHASKSWYTFNKDAGYTF